MSSLNFTSRKNIKNLFQKCRIFPLKRLGQNFLISKSILKKIIVTAEIKKGETILEIGPGIGVLTLELAKKAKGVIAIEKDRKMVEILKENLGEVKNVEIIQGDILKLNPESHLLDIKSYKLVANIPYYLTSRLIRKILESGNQPKLTVLIIQKEVARRICSKPPKMNLLAVSVRFYSRPKIISYVSKKSFWPQPKVDSAILRLAPLKVNKKVETDLLFKIVRAGFSQPRKQVVNNLSKMLKSKKEKTKDWLLKNGVGPSQRAETLSLNDWIKLTKNYIIE